jgi:hypothetical protein
LFGYILNNAESRAAFFEINKSVGVTATVVVVVGGGVVVVVVVVVVV